MIVTENTSDGPRKRLVCDGCERPAARCVPVSASDAEFRAGVRASGWRVYRAGSQWKDSCPGCVRDFARDSGDLWSKWKR